ncbi:MAG: redoxin domain-containing protein [Rickettsiales bacterium]|jgi:cytochrome c biogenesis protein CcmG, thiol:disulfide interchange protein DsbE|nr:redoxin domain-containing protein [Rickettsiales bacterium]
MRKKWLIFDIIVFLVIGAALLIYDTMHSVNIGEKNIFDGPLIGQSLPYFKLPDISGEERSYQSLLDDEADIKIINFFASWCKGCWVEHSFLTAINENLTIPIYGFAWNDKEDELEHFLNEHGNPYKSVIAITDDSDFANKLGLKYIPMSFIIDKNNKIIAHFQGTINAENFNYFLNKQAK